MGRVIERGQAQMVSSGDLFCCCTNGITNMEIPLLSTFNSSQSKAAHGGTRVYVPVRERDLTRASCALLELCRKRLETLQYQEPYLAVDTKEEVVWWAPTSCYYHRKSRRDESCRLYFR